MRVVKPQRASILQRVFEAKGARFLSLGVVAYVPFEAPELPLLEALLWTDVAQQAGKDAAIDEGLPKPRGEALLFGTAFAPGGKARPAFQVRVVVGPIDKTAYVVGRRRFVKGAPGDPEPIESLRLGWDKAFGGPEFADNPLGIGASPVVEDGEKVQYLPQIEDPKHLVTSPGDRPAPWAFGPIDPMWPVRHARVGTYDQRWLAEEFPGFARDLDPEYFMIAPPEQRIGGYFQGGEAISLQHLHPEITTLESTVPRLLARCFVSRRADGAEGEVFDEVSTRLETLVLLPNLRRMAAIFRGVLRVVEADATDVTCLVAALEHRDAPRPKEHYHGVWQRRLDKKHGALVALKEKDLLPELHPMALSQVDVPAGDMNDLLRREGILERRSRARAERELARARMGARVLGVDPDTLGIQKELPPAEEPPRFDDLAEYIEKAESEADKLEAEAEQKRSAALAQARQNLAEHGIDLDEELAKAKRSGGGPPKFRAAAHIEQMRGTARAARELGAPLEDLEAQIEDPALFARLVSVERAQLGAYRTGAHHMPAASPLDDDERRTQRELVEITLAAGDSLAGWDLTGADLRDLSLGGADLREALLEGADLRGASLEGANLEGAVLARALLEGVRLAGVNLAGANLGEARAKGASFDDARMEKATLTRGEFDGATFARAVLRGADVFEAKLPGADLTGAKADEVLFYACDLAAARLDGASLRAATFFRCALDGASFTGATLDGAGLVDLSATSASFRGARADSLRTVLACRLEGADFAGAKLGAASLRGASLPGARLDGVSAEGADFSESDLAGAALKDAYLVGARFLRAKLDGADLSGANLMDAMLQSAKIHGASLARANLFQANFTDALGDDRTSFEGAHVARALFSRRKR